MHYILPKLFEFCDRYQGVPQSKIVYKGYHIGFWFHIEKTKITNDYDPMYIILSVNPYIKQHLDEYLISQS